VARTSCTAINVAVVLVPALASAAVIERGDLRLEVNDSNGAIGSLQLAGNEYYREGSYVSDFGLQLGSDRGSFRINTALGPVQLATSSVTASGKAIAAIGTYGTTLGTLGWRRDYSLTKGGATLRIATTLTNTTAATVLIRLFDTFDPDQDSPSDFKTVNDRLSLGGRTVAEAEGETGTVVMGGPARGRQPIVAGGGLISISSGLGLNVFFDDPPDDDRSELDRGLHVGFELKLDPGESGKVAYFHGYGASSAEARQAFLMATPVPPAALLLASALGGLGLAARRRRRAAAVTTSPPVADAGARERRHVGVAGEGRAHEGDGESGP